MRELYVGLSRSFPELRRPRNETAQDSQAARSPRIFDAQGPALRNQLPVLLQNALLVLAPASRDACDDAWPDREIWEFGRTFPAQRPCRASIFRQRSERQACGRR